MWLYGEEDRQCTYNVTLRHVLISSITYSECASVVLIIQHAKRMRRIVKLSLACPALQYIFTLSHKRHDFRTKVFEYKIYVLIFSTTLSKNFSF